MTRNAALTIFAIIIGAMVLLWVLKLAFKLIVVAAVVAAAIAAFYAIKNRIGGPRA